MEASLLRGLANQRRVDSRHSVHDAALWRTSSATSRTTRMFVPADPRRRGIVVGLELRGHRARRFEVQTSANPAFRRIPV